MDICVGDRVKIRCGASKYHGVVGEVFQIERESEYAMVDMPKGTELALEGIRVNKILEQMKQSERTRKTPMERWPTGDPQWFPMRWLIGIEAARPAQEAHRAAAPEA